MTSRGLHATTGVRQRMAPDRLRASKDIRAAFAAGDAARGSSIVLHAAERGDGRPGRAAVVAGRNVGGAVQRNRVKRRLRAALAAAGVPTGTDVVVVGRAGALTAPFPALVTELRALLERISARAGAGR